MILFFKWITVSRSRQIILKQLSVNDSFYLCHKINVLVNCIYHECHFNVQNPYFDKIVIHCICSGIFLYTPTILSLTWHRLRHDECVWNMCHQDLTSSLHTWHEMWVFMKHLSVHVWIIMPSFLHTGLQNYCRAKCRSLWWLDLNYQLWHSYIILDGGGGGGGCLCKTSIRHTTTPGDHFTNSLRAQQKLQNTWWF